MPELFASARAWLATITPELPPALLIVFVFVSVYSLRRWAPGLWLRFEHALPFVDTIDPGPGLKVLLKFWQAIPGALIAAVGGALFTGASVKLAIWAVLASGIAAAAHEIWTDYATLRTAGALRARAPGKVVRMFPSDPPPPSNLGGTAAALILFFCFAHYLTACSMFGAGGSFWPVVENCAPAPSTLVSQVEDVLLAGGDYEAALKQLALKDAASAIECAVQAAVELLTAKSGKMGASPESAPAAARGKAFLAKVSK